MISENIILAHQSNGPIFIHMYGAFVSFLTLETSVSIHFKGMEKKIYCKMSHFFLVLHRRKKIIWVWNDMRLRVNYDTFYF